MEKLKNLITLNDAKKLKPVKVRYCKMFNLLRDNKPFAYYSNAYGWRFDLYKINDIYISTGYGAIGKNLSKETNEKIKNLDRQAWELGSCYPYEKREEKRRELLEKACALMVQD